jgi:hypothetical protein
MMHCATRCNGDVAQGMCSGKDGLHELMAASDRYLELCDWEDRLRAKESELLEWENRLELRSRELELAKRGNGHGTGGGRSLFITFRRSVTY